MLNLDFVLMKITYEFPSNLPQKYSRVHINREKIFFDHS